MMWNVIKYQIFPLPDDPAKLEKLAMTLKVSLAGTGAYMQSFDTAEVRKRIREALSHWRNGILFVFVALAAGRKLITLLR